MGAAPAKTALAEAQQQCQPLQDIFQQCADKFERERKAANGGREGWDNLGGFAASPCQVLFDDYNQCVTDRMQAHFKQAREAREKK